ncbi:MAG: TlpA family protein disulfide reductase [Proteobacteria bacterium]|nr:TlpA family protein disulfide reductase [Pseudomonadota bacterium]
MRPAARALTLAGLLVACAGGGYLLQRLTAPAPTLTVQAPGTKLPPPPAPDSAAADAPAEETRKIPEEVPDLSLPDLAGHPVPLSRYRGKLVLINFWAPWCEPCRREIPLLQKIGRDHAAKGFEVVGIALDHPPDVEKYAKEHDIHYPVLIAEKNALEAAQAFGMDTVLPFTVFADRAGHVVTLKVGELHEDEAGLILGGMEALDQGQTTLAQARKSIAEGIERLHPAFPDAPKP